MTLLLNLSFQSYPDIAKWGAYFYFLHYLSIFWGDNIKHQLFKEARNVVSCKCASLSEENHFDCDNISLFSLSTGMLDDEDIDIHRDSQASP